ncbi:MAG: hydantoinase B/oxoprolinase family protein [Pirellulales bacterium]|nr:hydantoinase B/oxoprolinase family protein [Pirellulales bacterium]
MNLREFWIDVGGTFTDCLSRAPDGRLVRHKLLSSGATKGTVGPESSPSAIFDPLRNGEPAEFWVGFDLTLLDPAGRPGESRRVVAFDPQLGRLELDRPAPASAFAGARYELTCGLGSPVLGIRYLLGLPLAELVPPIRLRLGTTRGTNALLTRRGARTALATTRGFGDLPLIGYQNRPRLFDLTIRKAPPLAERIVEIDERLAADGTVLVPVDESQVRKQLAALRAAGIESLAVCLLHADLYPGHEIVVERIARDIGFIETSRSSAVAPLVKIVSRGDTTTVDAYLNPVLRQYLAELEAALPGSEVRVMTSAGGLATPAMFRGHESVLSGPAGGVVGYARVAAAADCPRAIGFDMGGTSTDVSRFDGRFEFEYETEKAGVRLVTPTLAIDTVAAGGGSICGFDGVKLVVGPASAGADPGPACYGRGGPLAVTDLNVRLGRIAAERFPFAVDRAAVDRRLAELAEEVAAATGERLAPDDLAAGLLRIANANMARAIRNVTVAKGYQPGEYALVSFGGAAGQHACAVAEELGIRRILDHPDASLLSAYGIGLADLSRHGAAGVYRPAAVVADEQIDRVLTELEQAEIAALMAEGADPGTIESTRSLDVRYRGTDAALNVPLTPGADWREEFRRRHRREFGYEQASRELEVAVARVEVVARSAAALPASDSAPRFAARTRSATTAWFAGRELETSVFGRKALAPGAVVAGPALVAGPHSTLVVDPGWEAELLSGGELLLTRLAEPSDPAATSKGEPGRLESRPYDAASSEAVLLEVFNNLLAGVAERMGHVLRRTAGSVNVKERLDYSCAVFNAAGELAANAPHVPVHLGGMGATVRALIADNPDLRSGDVFLTNDPYRGGSHLPDLTVALPVHDEPTGELLFWTACRAHHAEIGGVRPGSMPPRAATLGEEGVVIANFRIVRAGESQEEALRELLTSAPYPSRAVEENLADVRAQVAAVQQGASDLRELAGRYGRRELLRQLDAIQTAAETKVRTALAKLPPGERRFVDFLETAEGASIPIVVRIALGGSSCESSAGRLGASGAIPGGSAAEGSVVLRPQTPEGLPILAGSSRPPAAIIDFTGTASAVAGNLNANAAIVSAAVMYVLRLLVAEDVPLNEGMLRAVEIVLPECVLNPRPAANLSESPAVAAGNVETSQRVVDVLLGALGLAAASQGTMNNLLFGNDRSSCYETICGGSGATAAGPGADAVQVHMTNTRATDPEVLERRLPVRLREFSIRHGSGGVGGHRGGDGAVRTIEFLEPMDVSLITQRRGPHPPFGAAGGEPGLVGENRLLRADGTVVLLPGVAEASVEPGDAIEIRTPGGGGWGAPL